MNWNQLRYVLTIAEEKSITRAAQRLYLTQPSLSLSLKALEEELGTPLFTRGPDGLEPTYAGSLFCAWAAETDISFGRLNDKLSDIASGRRQLLRLGVSPHRGNLLLPTILSAFTGSSPAAKSTRWSFPPPCCAFSWTPNSWISSWTCPAPTP